MAARNGININSLPFEQRCPPPDRRRKKRDKLTTKDRAVCAFCGAFLGLFLWVVAYVIFFMAVIRVVAKHAQDAEKMIDPVDLLPPFWWGSGVVLGFALFGAWVGAERMMDGFEAVLRAEGVAARAANRY